MIRVLSPLSHVRVSDVADVPGVAKLCAVLRAPGLILSHVRETVTLCAIPRQGVLDFLSSEEPLAQTLREAVEFRLVPMLNPDGVINGNYRCNLAGHDLNRRWKNPHRELHPTIFHYKQMIAQLARTLPFPRSGRC
jgi:hypothetical protein